MDTTICAEKFLRKKQKFKLHWRGANTTQILACSRAQQNAVDFCTHAKYQLAKGLNTARLLVDISNKFYSFCVFYCFII